MQRILIMGATSAIAEATARLFAGRGDAIMLVGRNAERLLAIAADLKVRGASQASTLVIDARGADYAEVVQSAKQQLGGELDCALIAHGTLTNQAEAQRSVAFMREEFETNALSVMALCTELANLFEARSSGTIAIISSVAGDRGRQSNYAYGAAKAAVSAFASGLRQRLYPKGVRVVTIKPGFVDTPMTASFKKGALWAKPDKVARDIVRAIERGSSVVYTPGFWRLIMLIIRSIPEFVFRRLRL
jgi:decaprenylphospho-beta-D-erythro-pentofuranosid-2-ulose 2-reductase